jgi:hypothetical protein
VLIRLISGYLLRRFLRRGARRASRGRGRGTRTGLFGPVPYASTRTRGGSRVTVGGCCLPIVAAPFGAAGLAMALRRRRAA